MTVSTSDVPDPSASLMVIVTSYPVSVMVLASAFSCMLPAENNLSQNIHEYINKYHINSIKYGLDLL